MEAIGAVIGGAGLATLWILSASLRARARGYPAAARTVLRVPDGSRCTALRYRALDARGPRSHVLVIPGNPGIVEFYERFAWQLHRGVAGGADVTVVGHLGHCCPSLTAGRVHSYAEQTEHKVALVSALAAGALVDEEEEGTVPAPTSLVLAGHSIGALMALEALRRVPAAPVRQVHLLTPTLHRIGDTPNGQRLTPLLRRFRHAVGTAVSAAGAALPTPVARALAAAHVGTEACAVEGAVVALQPGVARNALEMAWGEMNEVGDLDTNTVCAHAGRLRAVFAAKDGWVPPEHADLILSAAPGMRTSSHSDTPHAFVVHPQGDAVARSCAEWVKEVL